jgi:RHS repeat-associated protein
LLARTDANGHTTSYAYDADGRKISMTNPLGSKWIYSHDGVGNLTKTVTADGGSISRSYDAANRLLEKSYSDGTPAVSNSYDPVGNRISMTDATGNTTYAYDAGDRLVSATNPSGGFIYLYDSGGNLLSRTYPNGLKTSYLYDALGELTTATSAGQTTRYSYDADGNLASTLHPNGILDTRSYDAADHLTQIQGTRSNGRLFYSRSYALDAVGNPLSLTGRRQARATRWTESYSYDSKDRLTKACMSASCSSFFEYSYDPVGNRLSQRTEQGTTRYSYDAADQLLSARGPQRLNEHYTYDLNGNQTRKGSSRYSYDLENELTSLTEGRSQFAYTYSGDGLVSSKNSGRERTSYSWDTNAPLAQLALETDARRGALIRSYTYGVAPLGYSTRGASFTYHADSLGSTVELSDDRSASAGSYRYSPYGEDLPSGAASNSEADSNPIRFSGQYLDQDSGLYYMRAREYDPASGRFLEVDPKEAEAGEPDLSSYLYAEDDPTLLADPSGLDPRFHNKTLNCTKNPFLCGELYASGYKDGCGGYVFRKAVGKLYEAGIDFEYILAAANRQGKVGWSYVGDKGPGLYFFKAGGGMVKLEPPKDPSCGWLCSAGFGITQVFDCRSVKGCLVQDVLFFTPTPAGKGTRLMKAKPWLMKVLKLERKAQRVGKAAEVAKGASLMLGPATRFGEKIENQLARRGWTKRLVKSTLDDPARTVATRDVRHLPGGTRISDPATAYYSRRGGYIVRNNRTGDIVQVSNRTNPGWKAPWDH